MSALVAVGVLSGRGGSFSLLPVRARLFGEMATQTLVLRFERGYRLVFYPDLQGHVPSLGKKLLGCDLHASPYAISTAVPVAPSQYR